MGRKPTLIKTIPSSCAWRKGSNPFLTTQKQIMYYIDIAGRLIYEMCNMKSEITGFDDDGLFHIILLWE